MLEKPVKVVLVNLITKHLQLVYYTYLLRVYFLSQRPLAHCVCTNLTFTGTYTSTHTSRYMRLKLTLFSKELLMCQTVCFAQIKLIADVLADNRFIIAFTHM